VSHFWVLSQAVGYAKKHSPAAKLNNSTSAISVVVDLRTRTPPAGWRAPPIPLIMGNKPAFLTQHRNDGMTFLGRNKQ
jgi:hypothetical protein